MHGMLRPVEILLIEDNPADVELTQNAFADAKIQNHLHVVQDGQDGIDYLYQRDKFAHMPRPDIILLDLNMPRKDGRDVMEAIRQNPLLRQIPVAIMVGSEAESAVVRSYNLGARTYVVKPFDTEKIMNLVGVLDGMRLNIVKECVADMPEESSGKAGVATTTALPELEEFVGHICHDMHAPLRTVVFFTRRLQKSLPADLPEDARTCITHILHDGEKARAMLEGLQQYYKLCAPVPQGTQQTTNLHDIFTAARELLQEKIAAKGASLKINEISHKAIVAIDEECALQLTMHLLDNAMKFSASGHPPVVKVHATQEKDCWHLVVEDNGIGIDPRHHEDIFTIFRRLHRDDEYPGIGIGLTLAQKIVTRYGGTIGVKSEAGQGTQVQVILPAVV